MIEKLPSELHFGLSGNSFEGRSSELDGVYYFKDNINFEFEVGSSRYKDETLAERTSSQFMLGLGSDPQKGVSGGLQYSFWGLKDTLIVNTLKLPLRFNWPKSGWRFQLVPAHAVVKLPDIVILTRSYEIESDDDSLMVGVSYETPKDWIFTANYTHHEYEKDVSKLSRTGSSRLFSAETLSLAGALVNYRAALGVTRKFDFIDLGMQLFSAEYAIDESIANGLALQIDYYLKDNIKLDAEIAVSKVKEGLRTLTDSEKEPYSELTFGLAYSFD